MKNLKIKRVLFRNTQITQNQQNVNKIHFKKKQYYTILLCRLYIE